MGEYRYRVGRRIIVRNKDGAVLKTIKFKTDREAETYLLACFGFLRFKERLRGDI